MRWMQKPTPAEPKDGETRVIRKFLWWPKRLGNQWRWLEMANIEQYYMALRFTSGSHLVGGCWVDQDWYDFEFPNRKQR